MSAQQFPLKLSRERQPTYANFIANGNLDALAAIQALANETLADSIYLWGEGCGKTHLLLAASNAVSAAGKRAIYLSMHELAEQHAAIIDNITGYELVCIDDIDTIAAKTPWEESLFHLYNRIRDQGGCLLMSGNRSLAHLPIQLADLHSRLSWGASYQLKTLDDEGKKALLLQIAADKGMEMHTDSVTYLLRRYSRDIKLLVSLMDRLDRQSLASRQKITIPFLRQSLSAISSDSS